MTNSRRREGFGLKIYISKWKPTYTPTLTDTLDMGGSALFTGLILYLSVCELSSVIAFTGSGYDLKQEAWLIEETSDTGVSTEASSVKCKLQGTARMPVFSMDGDYIIGGVFSIHHYTHTVKHNYTTMPEPQMCKRRSVKGRCGGSEEYTLYVDRNISVYFLYDIAKLFQGEQWKDVRCICLLLLHNLQFRWILDWYLILCFDYLRLCSWIKYLIHRCSAAIRFLSIMSCSSPLFCIFC